MIVRTEDAAVILSYDVFGAGNFFLQRQTFTLWLRHPQLAVICSFSHLFIKVCDQNQNAYTEINSHHMLVASNELLNLLFLT